MSLSSYFFREGKKLNYKQLNKLGFKFLKDLEWFELEVLDYLVLYSQKGLFINNILSQINLDLPKLSENLLKQIIKISFLRFISKQEKEFHNFWLK
ncbi:MAG: hypothetical protein ACTSRZ_20890, partial [Promethearchaeota archaeon]